MSREIISWQCAQFTLSNIEDQSCKQVTTQVTACKIAWFEIFWLIFPLWKFWRIFPHWKMTWQCLTWLAKKRLGYNSIEDTAYGGTINTIKSETVVITLQYSIWSHWSGTSEQLRMLINAINLLHVLQSCCKFTKRNLLKSYCRLEQCYCNCNGGFRLQHLKV